MADLIDRTLELIPKYESPEGNVRNKQYDANHTAQGYWQITDTNWNAYGPDAGIDLAKFPHAMDASREDQKKVARQLLMNTNLGIKNWLAASDPKFLDEWDTLSQGQSDTPGTKPNQGAQGKKAPLKVDAPGAMEKFSKAIGSFATDPRGEKSWGWENPYGVVSGIKQFLRGAGGYAPQGQQGEYTPGARTRDVFQGARRAITPPAIAGTLPISMWEAPWATLAGLGIGTGTSKVGGAMGKAAGGEVSKLTGDPAWKEAGEEIGSDVGGVGGGYLAGGLTWGVPKLIDAVKGGGDLSPAQIRLMKNLPGIKRVPGWKMFVDYAADQKAAASKVGGMGGEKPPGDLPKTPEMDDAVHFGNVDEAGFKAHMKAMGLTDEQAQTKWDNAKSRSDELKVKDAMEQVKEVRAQREKAAKEVQAQREKAAKEAQRQAEKAAKEAKEQAEQQGPMMQATPEMIRSSTNPQGPPSVTLPEGITIKAPPPSNLPAYLQDQGPAPTGTMGPQLNPPPQMPVAPPPQNMGTLNPPVGQPGPPLAGPAAMGTPISPPLGQPPISPEPPISGTAGPQGLVNAPPIQMQGPAPSGTLGRQLTPDLPVEAPSRVPSAPGLNLPVNLPGARPLPPVVPKMTPISTSLPGELESMGIKIADTAEKLGKPVPASRSKRTLAVWEERMGLPEGTLTKEQMNEGRRVYKQRIRSREQKQP